MSEESPTVFGGRYELHRRLARGGMADVFLARDQLLGRPVAVKVLFPEYATDPKFVERFRREAQAAANLNHPNIVSIYDWGEELGTYYIVMEYVEGQSLAQILRRDGKLTVEQVTRVALDVSAALGFAHEGGVVHRDVKPGNVLVSPKGEMKVADFGIATALTSNVEANLTQTGAVMGTATYFSPEQAQGHKVDHRSDLYSLGVVIYEMLTGQPPFTGETPVSIAYKHVQEPATPVSDHGVDVPPALAAITMKLLSKNADNRYPSADALRSDLDRFRQGQAIVAAASVPAAAMPGPTMSRAAAVPAHPGGTQMLPATYSEPPRRRGGLIFVGLLTSLLILAGFLILLQSSLNTDDEQEPGEPTTAAIQQVAIASVGGRGEADARSTLEAQGLVVDRRGVASDTVAVGVVITTEPASGTTVNAGSTVTMVVSTGRNAAQVPSVLTMSQNEALDALVGAGFKVSINPVTNNLAPEGEVVAQSPEALSLYTIGETVTIDVSAGTEQIPMPDMRGFLLEDAKTFLQSEGFSVASELTFEFDDEIPMNAVVASNPPAGTLVQEGAVIELILSDGPEALFLPDLLGLQREVAKAQLLELQLVPLEFGSVVINPQLVGYVVDTIPAPGTVVEPGTQIQVHIGILDPGIIQPQPTTPPDIDGQGDPVDGFGDPPTG